MSCGLRQFRRHALRYTSVEGEESDACDYGK
jgi:hypothetical protein